LKEEVTFDDTRITSRSWEEYPILSFEEIPEIHVELIDRPHLPPVGVGEAFAGPTAAAIANAICDATGTRVRRMPFTHERLMRALAT
jgi:CO/xanthine dehydrogenase Mo-binding subunit